MKKATVTEKELRKAWTQQGKSKAEQDETMAAMLAVSYPDGKGITIDMTLAGPQIVLQGAERTSHAIVAQRRADAPLRPKKNQRPCDAGLFSDEKHQTNLF